MTLFQILLTRLILCAIIGNIISLLLKNKSQLEKAQGAKIEYTFKDFLRNDKWNIITSFLCVVIFFLAFGGLADPKHLKNPDGSFDVLGIFSFPIATIYVAFTSAISATVGFSSQEVMLKLFGKTNALINKLIKDQSQDTPMTPLK